MTDLALDSATSSGKITLRVTWKYCLAFYCIGMLYVSLHELAHHFAGYLICGEWGYKSFNYFSTACDTTAALATDTAQWRNQLSRSARGGSVLNTASQVGPDGRCQRAFLSRRWCRLG